MLKPQRRIVTVVALASCGVIVAGGIAMADDPPTTYTGCLKDGTLNSVAIGAAPKKKCVAPAMQISWNQAGVPGAAGQTGATGAAGPAGPQGAPGTSATSISGSVAADGTAVLGTGFTATWDVTNDEYEISFPAGSFDHLFVVTATPWVVGSQGSTIVTPVVSSITTHHDLRSGSVVVTMRSGTSPVTSIQHGFTFVVTETTDPI